MSVPYYGDFAEDDTVLIPFNTFSSNDPSASVTVTTLIASDIKVHKDGGTTEIATDGATIAVDFDARTGAHLITIDTSAHADYATGSEYAVMVEGATVDAGNITAWVGTFSIERAGGALALLKNGTYGLSALETIVDDLEGRLTATRAGYLDELGPTNLPADIDNILTDTGTTLENRLIAIEADTDVIDDGTSGLVKIASDVAAVLVDTADMQPRVAAIEVDTGTTLQAELDGIQADTEDIQTQIGAAGAGLSAVPWNAAWDAQVESEVTDSLVAHNLDHLCLTATAGADMTTEVADNTILSRIISAGDTSAFVPSTDSLQNIRDEVVVVDGIVDDILVDTNELQVDDIPGTLSTMDGKLDTSATEMAKVPKSDSTVTWNATALASINAEADTALTDYDPPTKAELDTAQGAVTLANGAHGGAAASITLADYSDFTGAAAANPNVLQSGTITVTTQTSFTLNAGSADDDAYNNMVIVLEDSATATQKSVRTITDYVGATKTVTIDSAPDFTIASTDNFDILAVAPGSTPPTAAAVADAVWDEDQADHVGAGTFGIVAGEVADILADTNELQTDDVPGLIAALNNVSTAEVNAQCDTAISDASLATAAELVKVPKSDGTASWNATALAAINAEADTALSDYDPPTKAEMDTGHGLLATEAKQDIMDTEVDAIRVDTEDIQARIPAALVSGRMSSDAVSISGSTDAADKLEASAETIVSAAAAAGTLSTTQMTTTLIEVTDDHYNGRMIVWTSGVLIRQATAVEDYDGATKMLTYTATTEAPSADDTFVIV